MAASNSSQHQAGSNVRVPGRSRKHLAIAERAQQSSSHTRVTWQLAASRYAVCGSGCGLTTYTTDRAMDGFESSQSLAESIQSQTEVAILGEVSAHGVCNADEAGAAIQLRYVGTPAQDAVRIHTRTANLHRRGPVKITITIYPSLKDALRLYCLVPTQRPKNLRH